MQDPAYMDALKASLLDLTAELRPLIREAELTPVGEPLATRRARYGRSITVTPDELRALLRVAVPFCMSAPSRRDAHAELMAAWATFAAELIDLNRDAPLSRHGLGAPRSIAAGLDLLAALKAWIERMRWVEATASAKVTWPKPVSISPVLRLRAAPDVPGLFDGLPPEKADGRKTWRARKRATKAAGVQREMLLPLATRKAPAQHSEVSQPGNQAARQVPAASSRVA